MSFLAIISYKYCKFVPLGTGFFGHVIYLEGDKHQGRKEITIYGVLWYAFYKIVYLIPMTVHVFGIITFPSCETCILSYKYYITEVNLSNSEKSILLSLINPEQAHSVCKGTPGLSSGLLSSLILRESSRNPFFPLRLEEPRVRIFLHVNNSREYCVFYKRSFLFNYEIYPKLSF